jgi:2,3-bisphosphoglycerate-dependent phosphoglycerate mutase
MYGALQGLNKADTARAHGAQQVEIWRRSYTTPPPPLTPDHPHWPGRDRRYASLALDELPRGESLEDTVRRFIPFWEGEIQPALRRGQRVLVVAHGNSLRALIKHLEGISDEEIPKLQIPTGAPLVYELDDDLRPVLHYYLQGPRA